MTLIDFLVRIKNRSFADQALPVVICVPEEGKSCLPFMGYLVSFLKKNDFFRYTILDISLMTPDRVIDQLMTLFLGEKKDFWLQFHHETDKRKVGIVTDFLKSYTGPHRVICESDKTIKSGTGTFIEIPFFLSADIFTLCVESELGYNNPLSTALIDYLFRVPEKRLTTNDLATLFAYATVAGKHMHQIIDEWLPAITLSGSFLFSLTHHFFVQDIRAFFKEWNTLKDEYPIAFWLSFWEDHLWKAAVYIHLMTYNNRQEAHRYGYRLPFIFTKKRWREFSVSYIVSAHHTITDLNRKIKSGSSEHCLEVFYCNFLGNKPLLIS